jgi:hypothetical protein
MSIYKYTVPAHYSTDQDTTKHPLFHQIIMCVILKINIINSEQPTIKQI